MTSDADAEGEGGSDGAESVATETDDDTAGASDVAGDATEPGETDDDTAAPLGAVVLGVLFAAFVGRYRARR